MIIISLSLETKFNINGAECTEFVKFYFRHTASKTAVTLLALVTYTIILYEHTLNKTMRGGK